MQPKILEQHLPQIRALCIEHGIERLDAFGSVLGKEFRPESDIDILVDFRRDASTNAFRQYFDFKEALEALLHRDVDLVCLKAIRNPVFKEELESTRRPLYAA